MMLLAADQPELKYVIPFPTRNLASISSGNPISLTCSTHFSKDNWGKFVPNRTLSFLLGLDEVDQVRRIVTRQVSGSVYVHIRVFPCQRDHFISPRYPI